MIKIDKARHRYRPAGRIDVLFIAEAPPADPSRFFYYDQVDGHDWLYLGLMRALFAEARELEVDELRAQKPDYLARLRAAGHYLIDASDAPMPKGATKAAKRRHLQAALPALLAKARELAGAETRLVLISRSVFDVCGQPLRDAGFRVANSEMIDFPASSQQPHFHCKVRAALRASDEHLQATIRDLEASVEYFGAGETQKRERERWIVEHFLRALGEKFVATEIEQPNDDPPDARYRGAAFEMKEIQQPGRRRGDEYREALAQAKAAISSADLLEQFTPRSLPIADAWQRVIAEAQEIARSKYPTAAVRRGLDLLYYLNLDPREAWDIEDGERPDLGPLIAGGWRSVSFLHGTSTACVMLASEAAPTFLRSVEGRLIRADHASD